MVRYAYKLSEVSCNLMRYVLVVATYKFNVQDFRCNEIRRFSVLTLHNYLVVFISLKMFTMCNVDFPEEAEFLWGIGTNCLPLVGFFFVFWPFHFFVCTNIHHCDTIYKLIQTNMLPTTEGNNENNNWHQMHSRFNNDSFWCNRWVIFACSCYALLRTAYL